MNVKIVIKLVNYVSKLETNNVLNVERTIIYRMNPNVIQIVQILIFLGKINKTGFVNIDVLILHIEKLKINYVQLNVLRKLMKIKKNVLQIVPKELMKLIMSAMTVHLNVQNAMAH